MKKVLFVATVDSHIELFHLPFLKMFKEKGWETSVATESDKPIKYCDKKISMPIKRSPFKLISNFKAIRKLRKIIKEEKYDIIHCHTPMGGVVARMAARSARKNGTRVIYTAHGFHFYKGAPLHFWLMFYPVEWYLAKYTDTLITINNEDYERAKKKFGKRCKDIQYVPGVGVDPKKFEKKMSAKEKAALRNKLGLNNNDKVLICIGRLDKNKNQGFLIRVVDELTKIDPSYHLLLVGPDEINGKYHKLVYKLGLKKNIHFLGFRKDIPELLQISDIAVSASKREGLPVNLIEAAMLGLPIVATDCRGNRDVCQACGYSACVQNDSHNICDGLLGINERPANKKSLFVYSLDNILSIMRHAYGFGDDLVSIIVPVFNGEKYIEKCLVAISEQDYHNIEIIVVDNRSEDKTKEIINNYISNKDDRVKYITCNKQGVSFARNTGIRHSNGKYICFVDCDDLVERNYIRSLLLPMKKYGVDLVLSHFSDKSVRLFDEQVIMANDRKKFLNFLSDAITTEFINPVFCKLYNRDIIINNKIRFDTNTSIGEDLLFNYDYLKNTYALFISDDVVYKYNKNLNPDSLTSKKFDEKRIDQLLYVNSIISNGYFGDGLNDASRYILMKNIYSVFKTFVSSYSKYSTFKEYYYEIKEKAGTVVVSKRYLIMRVLAGLYNSGKTFSVYIIAKVLSMRS